MSKISQGNKGEEKVQKVLNSIKEMICTPIVGQTRRCIFLWQKKEQSLKGIVQSLNYRL